MSDPVDLPELRRLAEAATPGPWAWDGMGPESMVSLNADACFIAALSPAVVLALLDRIDALEERIRVGAEFLDGLITHAGVQGYTDPAVGPVSTRLVLLLLRGDIELRDPKEGWWKHIHSPGAVAGEPKRVEVVHACPPGDAACTPCCGRTPLELPRTDRLTLDPALVTCGAVAGEPESEETTRG